MRKFHLNNHPLFGHPAFGRWIRCVALFLIITLTGPALGSDLDDVESGMDEALASSEGAIAEAEATRERREEEKRKLEKAQEEAKNAIARAKSKERDAREQIRVMDGDIQGLKEKTARFEQQKVAADKQYDENVKLIETKQQELKLTQVQTDAAKKENEKRNEEVAKLISSKRKIEADLQRAREEKEKVLADLAKAKDAETKSFAELKKSEADYKQKQSKHQKDMVTVKGQIQAARAKTVENEIQIRKQRQKLDQLSQEAEAANAEAQEAQARAEESESRLRQLRERTDHQKNLLDEKRRESQAKKTKYQTREVSSRVESSGRESMLLDQEANASDVGEIQVIPKSARRTLRRNCPMVRSPSSSAPVLGQLRQGQTFKVVPEGSGWQRIGLKDGGVGFVANDCFGQ